MIRVSFPGNKKVDALLKSGHVVHTDQPAKAGGDDTAPSPYELFLASLAACAGYFAQEFLASRGLSPDGVELRMEYERDPETHLVSRVGFHLALPPSFPEKYKGAIVRAMDQCTVKRQIARPPEFSVRTSLD